MRWQLARLRLLVMQEQGFVAGVQIDATGARVGPSYRLPRNAVLRAQTPQLSRTQLRAPNSAQTLVASSPGDANPQSRRRLEPADN